MFEEVFNEEENEFVNIADENRCYFDDQIIARGEKYYEDGKVGNVKKLGNVFVSDIYGSDKYTVRIMVDEEDEIYMSCDCPYEDHCKHEYATLLAIQNGDYEEKELKPYIVEKSLRLDELIRKIPAEALKKYILSDNGMKNTCFDMDDLEKTFMDYVPKQEYNYYYNNLYNSCLLRDDEASLYDSYFDKIRDYIDAADYEQAFYIIKSLIEVTHDLDIDIVSDYPELGMYLRISYRKADKEVKKIIEKYIMSLIFDHYYNNCYLEDMIININ